MLCRWHTTLNAGATSGLRPLPQPQAPSRAAGSFSVKSFRRDRRTKVPEGNTPTTGDGYGDCDFAGCRERPGGLCQRATRAGRRPTTFT